MINKKDYAKITKKGDSGNNYEFMTQKPSKNYTGNSQLKTQPFSKTAPVSNAPIGSADGLKAPDLTYQPGSGLALADTIDQPKELSFQPGSGLVEKTALEPSVAKMPQAATYDAGDYEIQTSHQDFQKVPLEDSVWEPQNLLDIQEEVPLDTYNTTYAALSEGRSKEEADKIIIDNAQNIKSAAAKFGVNPAILAAVIYAEQRLNVDWKDKLFDDIGGFYGLNTSVGVAQVRVSTAKFLEEQGYMPKINAQDGGWNIPGIGFVHGTETMARATALRNPTINIMYAAAYLAYIQDRWKEAYPEIDGRTAILATLYNQKETRPPHANPVPNQFGTFAKENYYAMRQLLGLD